MTQKVVFITGASSGIGLAIAHHLHQKGYKVFGTSRNPEKIKQDIPFTLLSLDVNDTESISQAVETLLKQTGRIDVLINNAGKGIAGPLEEIPEAEMKAVFDTNFFGPIRMIKAVLPSMRSQKKGLVINITSIAGYMGLPFRGVYSATKGALALVTESINMECRQHGIRFVNIAPGDFATNIASGRYHVPLQDYSPYRKGYQTSLEMMNTHVDAGGDPSDVAKMVHKIIENKNPKINYKAAVFTEKMGIVLKRLLPDNVYEKMLMKHFKL
ncbi:MAG: SDR family oxidoreductase [Bacteroidetes bacterium]|nr:SDR family oxidoreductase [Bacteroidota bacterium]